ncbi:hypothetical protein CY0110_15942 [Crocosphaera chwakensis CCY0110]|uniref:Uncharacterized protein n=1 Tax=Crocosphaera chwakensis CCY0110 TaxID=391612 RepID=A3IHM0_9CHRO|nr:hypothetical protein CY0110_15942 [Crocosphaera chwakensis CCY0110]
MLLFKVNFFFFGIEMPAKQLAETFTF